MFNTLSVACELKVMLVEGGIANQPRWFVNMMSWFSVSYDMQKFMQKAKMVLGDDDSPKQNTSAGKSQVRKK